MLEDFPFCILLLYTIIWAGWVHITTTFRGSGFSNHTNIHTLHLVWASTQPTRPPCLNPINPCVIVTTVSLIPKVNCDMEMRRWWMDFSAQEMTAEETPYPLSSPSSFFTLLPPATVTEPYLGLTSHSCQISIKMSGLFFVFQFLLMAAGWPALWMSCMHTRLTFLHREDLQWVGANNSEMTYTISSFGCIYIWIGNG